MATADQRSIAIAGVGHPRGLGAAIARRFAREGFAVAVLGRNAGKLAAAVRELRASGAMVEELVGDVTDPAHIEQLVEAAQKLGSLDAAVFNAGGNTPRGLLETEPRLLESMWRVNAYAGLLFAQAVLKRMTTTGHGTLVFTGASASLRGRAGFGAFASAKAALRALAQSAAREFGPRGIHVAHVIVDGAIDGDRIASVMPKLRDQRGPDGLLDPDAIADAYWSIHTQHRSAWTHELDLRPWVESW